MDDCAQSITDHDMITLACYQSDDFWKDSKFIEVHDKKMEIVDHDYLGKSGMEAFTVMAENQYIRKGLSVVLNEDNDEAIKMNGLSEADFIQLQIKETYAYVRYIDMTYGRVSSICGSGSGGMCANAIALAYPDIHSVTLDPMMLPEGMTNGNSTYPNITNYYSGADFLADAEEALTLSYRVPGNKYHLLDNGLGNCEGDIVRPHDELYKVPVGTEGKPGYGFIYVQADDHIVSSVWTGVPLYGGPSTKIVINGDKLLKLAKGLQTEVIDQLLEAKEYMKNADRIVQHEHEYRFQRLTGLQDFLLNKLHELAGLPNMAECSEKNPLQSRIDDLQNVTGELHHIFHEQPSMMKGKTGAASLFAEFQQFPGLLEDEANTLCSRIHTILDNDIPDMLGFGAAQFRSMTVEIGDHYRIISGNIDRLLQQLSGYRVQIEDAAGSFLDTSQTYPGHDQEASGKSSFPHPFIELEESHYFQYGMKEKRLRKESASEKVMLAMENNVRPLVISMLHTLEKMRQTYDEMIDVEIPHTGIPRENHGRGSVVGQTAINIQESVRRMKDILDDLEAGLTQLADGIPNLLQHMDPVVDRAIFKPKNYSDVRLYNIAASKIFVGLKLLFKDITYQLNEGENGLKATILEGALEIERNIHFLAEQIERGSR